VVLRVDGGSGVVERERVVDVPVEGVRIGGHRGDQSRGGSGYVGGRGGERRLRGKGVVEVVVRVVRMRGRGSIFEEPHSVIFILMRSSR